ncbi:MAG: DegV family protein [Erysipelotrichaceae bacterium]|nr:DegV family protein [Erysipelotrichaceae bacterium]
MIRILADSSTMYTKSEGKEMNVDIAPLSVTINNQAYREYEEINDVQFYELIKQGHLPRSSQPPVGEYMEYFETYADDDILVLCMADGLSGAYQSCASARANFERENIEVLNTKTLCGPHRYLLQLAIKLRNEGKSLSQIKEIMLQKIETSISFLLPQDFGYLKRGGRLTPLAATLGGLLKIQPVMIQTEDGRRLDKFAVGRNFDLAVNKVIKELQEKGFNQNHRFFISHAFVPEQAQKVKEKILKAFDGADIEIHNLSCAFITQGGPLCLAIQAIEK